MRHGVKSNYHSPGILPHAFSILRHDVDNRSQISLSTARLEQKLGISGTYYFRMVPGSYDEVVIWEISSLGHEIGYHYETLSQIGNRLSVVGKRKE